jgi:hypothetical protein
MNRLKRLLMGFRILLSKTAQLADDQRRPIAEERVSVSAITGMHFQREMVC